MERPDGSVGWPSEAGRKGAGRIIKSAARRSLPLRKGIRSAFGEHGIAGLTWDLVGLVGDMVHQLAAIEERHPRFPVAA